MSLLVGVVLLLLLGLVLWGDGRCRGGIVEVLGVIVMPCCMVILAMTDEVWNMTDETRATEERGLALTLERVDDACPGRHSWWRAGSGGRGARRRWGDDGGGEGEGDERGRAQDYV